MTNERRTQDFRTTPSDRREKLRQQGDAGRYKME